MVATDTRTPPAVAANRDSLPAVRELPSRGVRVMVASDPVATAVELARSVRADLASTAIEAELAIDRRRRAAAAARLERQATEAQRLADLVAGSDRAADDALLECSTELRRLAAEADPRDHVEAVRAAAGTLRAAKDDYRSAVVARDQARDERGRAAARLASHPSRSIADCERSDATAAAVQVQEAALRVRRAQSQVGPRPELSDDARRDLERVVRQIDRADHRVTRFGRHTTLVAIQAVGLGLAGAGIAMSQVQPARVAISAFLLPLVVAALWLLHRRKAVRSQLAVARRAGTAVTLRLFRDAVPDLAADAGRDEFIDPLETYRRLEAEREEHAARLAAGNAALEQALTDWATVAGAQADPDHLDTVFELAATLREVDAHLAAADDRVRSAETAVNAAREAWQLAVEAAGHGGATPDRSEDVIDDLRTRSERRRAARERVDALAAAEARSDAHDHLDRVLAGQSLDALIRAAERASELADRDVLDRPLVIADPGPPATGRIRRRTLRRLLDELRDAPAVVVVVAADAVADDWGYPRLS